MYHYIERLDGLYLKVISTWNNPDEIKLGQYWGTPAVN